MRNEKGHFVVGHKETPEQKEKRIKGMIKSWEKDPRKHDFYNTKFYNSWRSMTTRCKGTCGNDSKYKYLKKGIEVCERWLVFKNFLEDMHGTYKEGLTIDRIDNCKGYYKENCRWATIEEQANNKTNNIKINVKGENLTIRQISNKYNLPINKLRNAYYRKYNKNNLEYTKFICSLIN